MNRTKRFAIVGVIAVLATVGVVVAVIVGTSGAPLTYAQGYNYGKTVSSRLTGVGGAIHECTHELATHMHATPHIAKHLNTATMHWLNGCEAGFERTHH